MNKCEKCGLIWRVLLGGVQDKRVTPRARMRKRGGVFFRRLWRLPAPPVGGHGSGAASLPSAVVGGSGGLF